ncbi:hypothetical protein D3C74_499450 [compost metagenome]
MKLDQFLHLVDRALKLVNVHADVAQIAVEHQVAGDDIGHVAGAGLAAHPQPERHARHRQADGPK